ncbi:transposase-like protein [Rhizobium sp. RAS22]|nr:transposase-like protein [Rhizobium sp. RAS22]
MTIGGRKHRLWRAADQDGYVLDEIVQARRDTTAAKRLLIRLLKKQGLVPTRLSPKLRSYGAAKRDVMPAIEHRSHKGLKPCGKFPFAAAKTRTSDAGLPIRRRLTAIYLGFLSSQKSFRTVAQEALRPSHPNSSDPRHGVVEGRDRRSSLSQPKALRAASVKQRDNARPSRTSAED